MILNGCEIKIVFSFWMYFVVVFSDFIECSEDSCDFVKWYKRIIVCYDDLSWWIRFD